MAIGEFRIRINNRKLLKGILPGFSVPEDTASTVLRALDKIEKRGSCGRAAESGARRAFRSAAQELYRLIATKRTTRETLDALQRFEQRNETFDTGSRSSRASSRRSRVRVPDSAFCVDLGSCAAGLLHRHDLRDDARRRARGRQHLLRRAIRRLSRATSPRRGFRASAFRSD
jgi:histidyl-tRNA synthetase